MWWGRYIPQGTDCSWLEGRLRAVEHILARMEMKMATKAQLDQLTTDVAALIDAAVAEITAAVSAAQATSSDPAIDALDARVTDTTKKLTDASAALKNPPA